LPLHADLVALLAACRSAPADDTPRLVLADWLDDNADAAGLPSPDDARARAALIRIQVELARPTYDTARIVQLRAAEAQLLSAHAARWLGELPQRLDDLRRRKPFGFAAHRPPAVPQVFVLDPLAAGKPNNPWRFQRGLLTVDLYSSELLDRELGSWFASPLAAWAEEAGVEIGGLAALERLEVVDALRPYLGVRYALGRSAPPSMHLINPPIEHLTPNRCRRLVRCRNFALVRALTLFAPAITAEVLTALVGANVSALLRLSVKAPIGDAGAGLLAAAPLVNLSALDVSGCAIGADGLRLLACSAHLQQLVALTAFRNLFGCSGCEALATSPMAGRLNVLEIQNTGIGDRGAAALADSPVLDRLMGPGLNLSMNPIGDDGAKALAACLLLEPFTELVLRDCRIGDAGAAALAGSPHVANLTYLDLWHNRVGDAGARAFAAAPHLSGVRDLSLRDNLISAAGVDALREKFAERVKVEVARSLR
jgi:uncharacterized protein (TIGR02996 family)